MDSRYAKNMRAGRLSIMTEHCRESTLLAPEGEDRSTMRGALATAEARRQSHACLIRYPNQTGRDSYHDAVSRKAFCTENGG